ncbi:MAG: chloride channel protein, partial [Rhizobiales bacterium]|nr:chloride channel protein [Hyphomicrobiales bacterium]
LMIASVTSGIVTEAIAGRRPFMDIAVPDVAILWLPAFVVLGIALGGIGVLFNRTLVGALDLALAIGRRSSFYIVPLVVGFSVGVLLLVLPEATMGGENLAVRIVSQNLPLTVVALIVVIRFSMTMASYSTGVPGGIFAPILSLATAVGLLYGLLLSAVLPVPAGMETAFAVAAMAGLFTATVRAPLVGIVLIAELTGAYSTFIPAIVTCLCANVFADWLGGRPIYEVLLERTLRLAGQPAPATAPATADQSPQIGGWDQR